MSNLSNPIPEWLQQQAASDRLLVTPDVMSLDEAAGNSLADCLQKFVASNSDHAPLPVVIDLRKVKLITSPGIGALILIHRRLKSQGMVLIILHPAPMVVASLEFLKLDQMLTICRTTEEVEEALRG